MRVRFLRDRLWTPREDRRLTVAYKAGMELTVKRSWGDQMVSEGVAEEIEAPSRRGDEPGLSVPARRPLTPAQIKALDGDGDGSASGSLPRAKA